MIPSLEKLEALLKRAREVAQYVPSDSRNAELVEALEHYLSLRAWESRVRVAADEAQRVQEPMAAASVQKLIGVCLAPIMAGDKA